MGQITRSGWICAMLFLVGCATSDKLSFKPNFPSPWRNSSVASQPKSQPSEFSTSKKLKDPVKVGLAYASMLEQSADLVEARKAYLSVLEKSSKNTEALLGLSRIDRAYGRDADADALLAKALKYHPKEPNVQLAIGQAHAARDELDEAIEHIQMACELAPYEKLYEFHLAVVEVQAGDYDQALIHFTHSTGKAEAYFNVGHMLSEQGNKSEAEKYFAQALKLKPDLKKAETELAAIRMENGEDVQPASFRKK